MKRIAVVLVIGLVGCAGTPPTQLSPEQFNILALQAHTVNRCGVEGKMTAESTSDALKTLIRNYRGYAWNDNQLKAEIQRLNLANKDAHLPIEVCRQLAIQAAVEKPNNTVIHSMPANPSYNAPSGAYCNTIGSQTFCRAY